MAPSAISTQENNSIDSELNHLSLQKNASKKAKSYEKTKVALELERKYAAGNYHPLGVVFERALAAKVWDVDGNEYIDCLSAYSAVNQ